MFFNRGIPSNGEPTKRTPGGSQEAELLDGEDDSAFFIKAITDLIDS